MADRPISELSPVTTVTNSDNFVLEQSNRAMRLTGQVLINWLLRELDAHGGIRSIEKTGTSGLTDTYTITYADETTTTFTVNNAKSISGIAQYSTQTLQVTYRISFNDGTHFDFPVKEGKGISNVTMTGQSGDTKTYRITYTDNTTYTFTVSDGTSITNISKTSTSGIEDVYTITYSDGETTSFTVTNGRGINTVTRTSTSGLVDTYTIAYNDGTTSTFDITNGAKGDNTYTWVKYSATRPTSNADMKDDPDDWIGIYTGGASSAPTTYTSYAWYRIRGEKGDTGDDLTVSSTDIRYGTSSTESAVPTSWSVTMPTVPQGQYLWVRTIFTFSDGSTSNPIYIKSRMGIDGSGAVSTVNHISPDEFGNVQLQLTTYESLTVNELMSL